MSVKPMEFQSFWNVGSMSLSRYARGTL